MEEEKNENELNIENEKIYMDGYLKSNLDILKKNISKDWDFWFIVDGVERSGKSTLATQCAKYLDNNFNISRVVFTPQEFELAVEKAEKYQAIVWDEAITGTLSFDYNKMSKTLQKKAVQIGQKNLFIILVLHSFFDMKKYFAIFRTWFLLHTYVKPNPDKDEFDRGFFLYFDFEKKKKMYCNDLMRKNYIYSEKPNFYGRFTKKYGVDEKLYRLKKSKIQTGEVEGIDDKTFVMEATRRNIPVYILKKYINFSETHLYRIKREAINKYMLDVGFEENEENINNIDTQQI